MKNKAKTLLSSIKRKLLQRLDLVTASDLSMSALDVGVDIVVGNQVPGDYIEFGVYEGASFIRVYQRFKAGDQQNQQRRYIACDSFQGLPASSEEKKPSQYFEGNYSASEDTFMRKLSSANVDLSEVVVIPGFYNESLTETSKISKKIAKFALIYIDVDLEASARDVLNFVESGLQTGTVIVLDDWLRHSATPRHGIQKAFKQWLVENPHLSAHQVHLFRRTAFVIEIEQKN